MTYEKLLAKINHQADVWDEPMAKALRAVVELHKSDGHFCVECSHDLDYLFNYPCNTIQAIEKAFK